MATSEAKSWSDRAPVRTADSFVNLIMTYGYNDFTGPDRGGNYYSKNPSPLGYNSDEAPFYLVHTGRLTVAVANSVNIGGEVKVWSMRAADFTNRAYNLTVSTTGVMPATGDINEFGFSLRHPLLHQKLQPIHISHP